MKKSRLAHSHCASATKLARISIGPSHREDIPAPVASAGPRILNQAKTCDVPVLLRAISGSSTAKPGPSFKSNRVPAGLRHPQVSRKSEGGNESLCPSLAVGPGRRWGANPAPHTASNADLDADEGTQAPEESAKKPHKFLWILRILCTDVEVRQRMPARALATRCDEEIRRHKPLFENRTLSQLCSVCEARSLGSPSKAICVPDTDTGT